MVIGLMGQRTDGSAGHRARERCANAEIPELLFRKCMVFSIDFLYIRTDHQYFSSYCKSAPAKSHPRAEPMGQWVSGLMGHKGFTRLMSQLCRNGHTGRNLSFLSIRLFFDPQ